MMNPLDFINHFLFPPKCILCGKVLENDETDLCRECRATAPEHPQGKLKLQFIDSAAVVWYYRGTVRQSLHRYKFRNACHLAEPFGRMLAMKVLSADLEGLDLVTWVPISPLRKITRGYDQDELLARVVARELGLPCVPLLKKVRHNKAQSGIEGYAKRRANVLGVYEAVNRERLQGAKILLVDDILTTGATASECARVLLTWGAKEIHCAVVASAHHNNPK
jgi:ComF family protein